MQHFTFPINIKLGLPANRAEQSYVSGLIWKLVHDWLSVYRNDAPWRNRYCHPSCSMNFRRHTPASTMCFDSIWLTHSLSYTIPKYCFTSATHQETILRRNLFQQSRRSHLRLEQRASYTHSVAAYQPVWPTPFGCSNAVLFAVLL